MEDGCLLCDRKKFEKLVIFENEHFCLMAAPNQIKEGYMVLFPQQHKTCLGDLDKAEIALLDELIVRAISVVSEEYQPPLIFEYGDIGASIKHAHLHIVPVTSPIDLYSHIKKSFRIWARIHSFSDLHVIRWRFGNYIFYRNSAGIMTAFIPISSNTMGQGGHPILIPKTFEFSTDMFPKIDPKYFETILAGAIGKPEYTNLHISDQELNHKRQMSTRDRLKKYFS